MPTRKWCSNYMVLDDDTIIAWTEKCGSSTLRRTLSPHVRIKNLGAPKVLQMREENDKLQVILVVREPMARLLSCWNFFMTTQGELPVPIKKPLTFIEFLEHVVDRRHYNNYHWIPQTQRHTHNGEWVPTRLVPLEHLSEFLVTELGFEPKLQNVYGGKVSLEDFDIPADLMEKVRERYAEDFKLYEAAVADW